MIRVRGLISSIKSNLLINRNVFPHKIEESWDSQFNQKNPKLNHLQKLLESNSIRPYFIQKDIKQLEKQDIYFYMQNKELFHKIPNHTKQQLIKNPNANTILKFHLALELQTLRSQEVQRHLLNSFNGSVKNLGIRDVLFCLELITNFNNIDDNLNYNEIEKKILAQQTPEICINLVFLLSQLEFPLQTISKQFIKEKISMLENFQIQTVFQVKSLSKFYGIQLASFTQNRFRLSFTQKRQNFSPEQGQCIVQLLQFYPQSANLLNTQCLTTESYSSYLQFFKPSEEHPLNYIIPKVIYHPIPKIIVKNSDVGNFFHLIRNRILLQLDTPQSLVLNAKDYYTSQLNCIIALIRYLEKQEKLTSQLQSLLEKSILRQIIKNGLKSLQQYKIVDVFKMLGYLSVNNLGTINFWKKALKFVASSIEDSHNYKNLGGDQQKKFVVYLFQIFKNKPFPRQLQDQIINLTLLSLTINRWSIREILPLTVSLKVNKIADNQLWFGIEQRIKQMNIRYIQSLQDRKALKKIVYNFNMIGKGSYQFWSEINKNLNKKQKTQILSSFKIPSTMAHTYLKI